MRGVPCGRSYGLAIHAKYAILSGKEHSEEELTAWKPIEDIINQFKSADKHVIVTTRERCASTKVPLRE